MTLEEAMKEAWHRGQAVLVLYLDTDTRRNRPSLRFITYVPPEVAP